MKPYKFLKIQRHDIKSDPHWVVCIDSHVRMGAYHQILAKRNVENYFLAKHTILKHGGNPHFGAFGGLAGLQRVITMELDKHNDRKSIVDDLTIISKTFDAPYWNVFNKFGTIYCNPVGGFYPASVIKHTVLEELESDNYELPVVNADSKDKIEIIQWPNGTHYYAKIGIMDVVDDDGNQKWDTYEDAQTAADTFLMQLKYS